MRNLIASFPLVIILLFLIGITGWTMNIYKLTQCDFEAPYKAELIHMVGLVPVVGGITGWLDLGK